MTKVPPSVEIREIAANIRRGTLMQPCADTAGFLDGIAAAWARREEQVANLQRKIDELTKGS